MLQSIRDKSQGIIAIIIIAILVLSFALWGIHNYFDGSSANTTLAKVNGQKISNQAFDETFQRIRLVQMQENPQLFSSQAAINVMKHQVLESMVQTTLLTQAAYDNDFRVGQSLLALSLAHMPLFQENGEFSRVKFENFLSNMMFTQQDFFQQLENTILLAQMRSGFQLTAFALPYQVQTAVALINQSRSFTYVEVPANRFLPLVHISPDEIQAYYQQHQAAFTLPAQVSVNYIELSLDALTQQIHPTVAELQDYYQSNINHYTLPKQWQLAHILIAVAPGASQKSIDAAAKKAQQIADSLKQGQDFSAVAEKKSDDIETAQKGGVLPSMTLLQMDNAWQNQVYQLKTVGEFSPPFQTEQGFEIIKLLGSTPAKVQPYAVVAEKVKQDYIQQKAEKQFADLSDVLSNLTFEHPDTLAPAAKKLGLTVKTTEMFSKAGGKTGVTTNPKVISAAFSNDVFKEGNNSDPVQLSDTSVMVLRAAKTQPAAVKSLNDVQEKIRTQLTQKETVAQAKQLAQEIMQGVQAGQTLGYQADQHHLSEAHSPGLIKRNNGGSIDSSVVQAAFQLQEPNEGKPSVMVVSTAKGAAVVQLNEVQSGTLSSVNQKSMMKYYKMGTEQSLGGLEYVLFVKSLHNHAKIKYYVKNSIFGDQL